MFYLFIIILYAFLQSYKPFTKLQSKFLRACVLTVSFAQVWKNILNKGSFLFIIFYFYASRVKSSANPYHKNKLNTDQKLFQNSLEAHDQSTSELTKTTYQDLTSPRLKPQCV
jgi:hypothetical protein